MFKLFKKKKNEEHDLVMKLTDHVIMLGDKSIEIMQLINENQEMIDRIAKNDYGIARIVESHDIAIKNLEKQINELQKLVNQNEGV